MRAPLIRGAKAVERYRLGSYLAVLFAEIESVGAMEYLFILALLEEGAPEPRLFITSEVNAMAGVFGGGSHFLGLFDQTGHANMGASDEWAERERFTTKALALAAERLGVADPPERLPS